MTSRDVVNVVQRRIRPIKVGHCGTLDPLADGVLVLGVGAAVRLTSYVQASEKVYEASFRLGASSDTGDLENGCVQHHDLPVPTDDQIQTAARGLVGEITQVPPAYSAIWVDGKRAYRRARAGEQVQMPSRTVSIQGIDVLRYDYPELRLRIVCGSGTYIRTLGLDLAQAVGTVAVMTELTRLAVGTFAIDQALTIDQLREDSIDQLLTPARTAVEYLQRIIVDEENSIRLGHGLPLTSTSASDMAVSDEPIVAMTEQGDLRAIVRQKPRGWCPIRVFPVSDTGNG